MSDETEGVRIELVPLAALLLDPNNPRLIEDPAWPRVPDEEIPKPRVQREVAERLLGERGAAIQRLLESIEEFGWVDAEPVRVRSLADGRWVVSDGNRRIVALRRLAEDDERFMRDVRVFVEESPDDLDGRKAHGARHTLGRTSWSALGEVVWRRKLEMEGVELEPGPSQREDALRLCVEYRRSRWGDQFRPETFVLIHQLVSRRSIRRWLTPSGAFDSEHLQRLFSWISKHSEDGIDGMASEPVLRTFGDVHKLDTLLEHPEGPAMLDRANGDLRVAWNELVIRREVSSPLVAERVAAYQRNLGELRRRIEAAGEEPVEPTSELPWPVSFTDAWPSLTSLRIARYRGLSEVSLDGLTRINLLVGVNNAGKTSVLEAIYLLCRQADPRGLLDSIRARVRTDPEALPPTRLLGLLPGSASIAGTLGGSARVEVEHTLSDEPPSESADLATFLTSLRIAARGPTDAQVTLTELHSNRPRRTRLVEGSRGWLAPAILHSPFSLADRKVLTDCYERSVETKVKSEIIDFVRAHVDDGIEDIALVNAEGRFLVQHRTDGALDLSSYGEGMQRIFQIALLFAEHAHGVVLIDEFENALHTRVLGSFSRLIQELAVRFDVQVFLTTHSDEALEAFLRNDYRLDDVTTYLLKKDGGRIAVRRFDGKSHRLALEAAGTDVRRL